MEGVYPGRLVGKLACKPKCPFGDKLDVEALSSSEDLSFFESISPKILLIPNDSFTLFVFPTDFGFSVGAGEGSLLLSLSEDSASFIPSSKSLSSFIFSEKNLQIVG